MFSGNINLVAELTTCWKKYCINRSLRQTKRFPLYGNSWPIESTMWWVPPNVDDKTMEGLACWFGEVDHSQTRIRNRLAGGQSEDWRMERVALWNLQKPATTLRKVCVIHKDTWRAELWRVDTRRLVECEKKLSRNLSEPIVCSI